MTDLYLSLLYNIQGNVGLNPEISDGAFKLRVPEQELNGPEIPGPPVDQPRFSASQSPWRRYHLLSIASN